MYKEMLALAVVVLALIGLFDEVRGGAPSKHDPQSSQKSAFERNNEDNHKLQTTSPLAARSAELNHRQIERSNSFFNCKDTAVKQGLVGDSKSATVYCMCSEKVKSHSGHLSKPELATMMTACRFMGQLSDSVRDVAPTIKAQPNVLSDAARTANMFIQQTPWVDEIEFDCWTLTWHTEANQLTLATRCGATEFNAQGEWKRTKTTATYENNVYVRGVLNDLELTVSIDFGASPKAAAATVTAAQCSGHATVVDCVPKCTGQYAANTNDPDCANEQTTANVANEIWKALGDKRKPVCALGVSMCKVLESSIAHAVRRLGQGKVGGNLRGTSSFSVTTEE